MKVLHISYWYPNKWETHEAQFIRDEIQALGKFAEQELLHIQLRNEGSLFKINTYDVGKDGKAFIIDTKLNKWKLIELIQFFLICCFLLRKRHKRYEILNFHIAYPNLAYIALLKKIFKKPIVVNEHWSAYHLNFGMPENAAALKPIKRMFHHGVPVIGVSKALVHDIKRFSGNDGLESYVVPNVVDKLIFHKRNVQKEPYTFLMVNNWRPVKNPYPVLNVWKKLVGVFPECKLRIVGYGVLWEPMQNFVKEKGLTESIKFIGKLDKEDIANEMNKAHALLFSSDYETFSVVCAEAVSCGTPVVGPFIPAIGEYIDASNGLLIQSNDEAEWLRGLQTFIRNCKEGRYEHERISERAHELFSANAVGRQYFEVLKKIAHDWSR